MLPFRLFWPNRYPLVTIFRIFHLARCEGPAPFLAPRILNDAKRMIRSKHWLLSACMQAC